MAELQPDYTVDYCGKVRDYWETISCPRCGTYAQLTEQFLEVIGAARQLAGKPELDIDDRYIETHEAFSAGHHTISMREIGENGAIVTLHAVCRNCRVEWAPLVIYTRPDNPTTQVFNRPSPGARALQASIQETMSILDDIENQGKTEEIE